MSLAHWQVLPFINYIVYQSDSTKFRFGLNDCVENPIAIGAPIKLVYDGAKFV